MTAVSLADRMRAFEAQTVPNALPRKSWQIIRLDGRAFHSWTRGLARPFDQRFADWMDYTAQAVLEEVSGAVMAYVQSDEISIIANDFGKLDTQQWFGGKVQKIVSVSASLATAAFNSRHTKSFAHFDSRVFALPDVTEVANYLIWRQRDCKRNAVSMAAQTAYSHKQLHKKNTLDMLEMLEDRGYPWHVYPQRFRHGGQVTRVHERTPVTYYDTRYPDEPRQAYAEHGPWTIAPAPEYQFESLMTELTT